MLYLCYDIDWDTDEEDVELPSKILVKVPLMITKDKDELEQYLSDYLSDNFGGCHNGFNYKEHK